MVRPLFSEYGASQLLYLFQLGRNQKFLFPRIILDGKHIGPTAYLAIFHVSLGVPGGLVHRCLVPLTTGRTLETCIHRKFIFNFPLLNANEK